MPDFQTTPDSSRSTQVRYDAGPKLIEAIEAIERDQSNPNIERLAAALETALRGGGITDTSWLAILLYQFRGAMQGVPGDLEKFKANIAAARRARALGPRGASALLGRVEPYARKRPGRAATTDALAVARAAMAKLLSSPKATAGDLREKLRAARPGSARRRPRSRR